MASARPRQLVWPDAVRQGHINGVLGGGCLPVPNGAKAALLRTITGYLYHLSGINLRACSKQSSPVRVLLASVLPGDGLVTYGVK